MGFSDWESNFARFGIVVVAYWLLKLSSSLWRIINSYVLTSTPDFRKYGKWTVVTGATDGIGKETARQLASRKLHVALISRSAEKLEIVAKEIERDYGVETKTLQVDFCRPSTEIYGRIEDFLRGMDIGVLVNNVGQAPTGAFGEGNNFADCIERIVNVNVLSVYRMTQIVLSGMKQRRRGLILNLSSLSAVINLPYMALYGSTKSLVDYFAQAIADEVKEYGIVVQSVTPGVIHSNLTKGAARNFYNLDVDYFVKSWLGTVEKEGATMGSWIHHWRMWQMKMMPRFVLIRTIRHGIQRLKDSGKDFNKTD